MEEKWIGERAFLLSYEKFIVLSFDVLIEYSLMLLNQKIFITERADLEFVGWWKTLGAVLYFGKFHFLISFLSTVDFQGHY